MSSTGKWRRLMKTGYRSLEVPGPGAVAHMSLHQKPTMSKSRSTMLRGTAFVPPVFTGGTGCLSMLATVAVGGGSRQRRVGEVHLGGVPDSVNGFLQFCFAKVAEWRKSAVFGADFPAPMPLISAVPPGSGPQNRVSDPDSPLRTSESPDRIRDCEPESACAFR